MLERDRKGNYVCVRKRERVKSDEWKNDKKLKTEFAEKQANWLLSCLLR